MPMPGGYCTASCATDACPPGSVCAPTGRGGELGVAACTRDADCRADEGYVCDPARHGCVLPFATSPVIGHCMRSTPLDAGFTDMTALTTAASPGAYQFEPSAVVTPAGDVVALYTGGAPSFFAPSFLGVLRVPADGSPATDTPLPTSKRMHFDPWVAIDRAGTIHAVWLGHDGGGVDLDAEIGYARSTDGGRTWSEPRAIHDPAACAGGRPFCLDKPMIAIGPEPGAPRREAIRVFYASEGEPEGMTMITSTDGGAAFGAPVPVLAAAYGDVAIDASGTIHVVAADASPRGAAAWGSPANRVVYVRSTDGTSFGAPVAVSGPGESIPFYFVNPTVAIDGKRRLIYVAYVAGTPDGAWTVQLAISKDAGRTWTRRALAPDACHQSVPDLAIAADGGLHATWYQTIHGGAHRVYARCKPGGASCSAPAVLGQAMTTYELVRHSPRWIGEYTALVVDDRRHAVHALWTQVMGEDLGGRGAARIVHARGRL
jgi:VCBS repeat-containing protein